jgi:hypothetical protein
MACPSGSKGSGGSGGGKIAGGSLADFIKNAPETVPFFLSSETKTVEFVGKKGTFLSFGSPASERQEGYRGPAGVFKPYESVYNDLKKRNL